MFLIFGLGHRKNKKLGETKILKCEKCKTFKKHIIVESSSWFTVFFVPVFPFKKEKLIVCPVCNTGFDYDENRISNSSNEDFAYHKKLLILKKNLDDGKIDINDYKRKKIY